MLSLEISQFIRSQVAALIKKDAPELIRKQVNEEVRRILSMPTVPTAGYQMLKRGAVNLRDNAMIGAQDVYGRVILASIPEKYGNEALYQKMKNRINYGVKSDTIARNMGKYTIK